MDRDWTREAWEWLLREQLGLRAPEPCWLDQPAIARHSISSPALHRLLATLNDGLTYADQVKPFNFLSIAFVHPLERPPDDPRLVLIAPYRDTVAEQLAQSWLNRYSGMQYTITTRPSNARHRPGIVTVKTYRDMLAEYAVHPEAKSNAPDDDPCGRRTVGTLNSYDDLDQLALQEWALPILRELGVREVARRTGHSLGAVHAVLAETASPRPEAAHRYLASIPTPNTRTSA